MHDMGMCMKLCYSFTLELKICFLTMASEIMETAPMKLHDGIMQRITWPSPWPVSSTTRSIYTLELIQ